LWVVSAGLIVSLILSWRLEIGWLALVLGEGKAATVAYLALISAPIVFSSIFFSFLIKDHPAIDQALGSNLLGCMFGGCLEYAAIIVGYKALILAVAAFYGTAMLMILYSYRLRSKPQLY
jgi:hypothetical protein